MGLTTDGTRPGGPGSSDEPPVIHASGHQHRNPVTGRYLPCPAECSGAAQIAVAGAPFPCNSAHDRWVQTAINSEGRVRLLRHIQQHYVCRLAIKFMVSPGTAAVAFAAMVADTFCTAGLFRDLTPAGNPITRFAYFYSPLKDWRDAKARDADADIDFITNLILSGKWRPEDVKALLPPDNLIDFNPRKPVA